MTKAEVKIINMFLKGWLIKEKVKKNKHEEGITQIQTKTIITYYFTSTRLCKKYTHSSLVLEIQPGAEHWPTMLGFNDEHQ